MEAITVHIYLQRGLVIVRAIRAEEMPSFCQIAMNKHKQLGSKVAWADILAVVNLCKVRLLRLKGKVWDQLTSNETIWFVTAAEWKEYCDHYLPVEEQQFRHGKRLVARHPNSMSPEKLAHFVAAFFEEGRPIDPTRKFLLPPPSPRGVVTSPVRRPGSTGHLPLSPGDDSEKIRIIRAALMNTKSDASRPHYVSPIHPNAPSASDVAIEISPIRTGSLKIEKSASRHHANRKPHPFPVPDAVGTDGATFSRTSSLGDSGEWEGIKAGSASRQATLAIDTPTAEAKELEQFRTPYEGAADPIASPPLSSTFSNDPFYIQSTSTTFLTPPAGRDSLDPLRVDLDLEAEVYALIHASASQLPVPQRPPPVSILSRRAERSQQLHREVKQDPSVDIISMDEQDLDEVQEDMSVASEHPIAEPAYEEVVEHADPIPDDLHQNGGSQEALAVEQQQELGMVEEEERAAPVAATVTDENSRIADSIPTANSALMSPPSPQQQSLAIPRENSFTDRELLERLHAQERELEETRNDKKSLEARLDEARYLLQMLARTKKTEVPIPVSIEELESSLADIFVDDAEVNEIDRDDGIDDRKLSSPPPPSPPPPPRTPEPMEEPVAKTPSSTERRASFHPIVQMELIEDVEEPGDHVNANGSSPGMTVMQGSKTVETSLNDSRSSSTSTLPPVHPMTQPRTSPLRGILHAAKSSPISHLVQYTDAHSSLSSSPSPPPPPPPLLGTAHPHSSDHSVHFADSDSAAADDEQDEADTLSSANPSPVPNQSMHSATKVRVVPTDQSPHLPQRRHLHMTDQDEGEESDNSYYILDRTPKVRAPGNKPRASDGNDPRAFRKNRPSELLEFALDPMSMENVEHGDGIADTPSPQSALGGKVKGFHYHYSIYHKEKPEIFMDSFYQPGQGENSSQGDESDSSERLEEEADVTMRPVPRYSVAHASAPPPYVQVQEDIFSSPNSEQMGIAELDEDSPPSRIRFAVDVAPHSPSVADPVVDDTPLPPPASDSPPSPISKTVVAALQPAWEPMHTQSHDDQSIEPSVQLSVSISPAKSVEHRTGDEGLSISTTSRVTLTPSPVRSLPSRSPAPLELIESDSDEAAEPQPVPLPRPESPDEQPAVFSPAPPPPQPLAAQPRQEAVRPEERPLSSIQPVEPAFQASRTPPAPYTSHWERTVSPSPPPPPPPESPPAPAPVKVRASPAPAPAPAPVPTPAPIPVQAFASPPSPPPSPPPEPMPTSLVPPPAPQQYVPLSLAQRRQQAPPAALQAPLSPSQSTISMAQSSHSLVPAFDIPPVMMEIEPIQAVLAYFRPFLLASKYQEDISIRGLRAHRQLSSQCSRMEEQTLFAIFQLYGSPEMVVVRNIKTSQISRAVNDARLASVTSSALDLELLRINARLTAKHPASAAEAKVRISKTGSAIVPVGTAVTSSNSMRAEPVPANCASFSIYVELLKICARPKAKTAKAAAAAAAAAAGGDPIPQIVNAFHSLLQQRDLSSYCRLGLECRLTVSGVFLRSPYSKYYCCAMETAIRHALESDAPRHRAVESIRVISLQDCEAIRAIWDRNLEQIRQIYAFYTNAVEVRRVGGGVSKLLMSADKCKEMLQDFQLLPQVLDIQTFYRLFRAVKLWEWEVAESVLLHIYGPADGSNSVDGHNSHSPSGSFMRDNMGHSMLSMHSHLDDRSQVGGASIAGLEHDPLDFRASIGNFSITIAGFIELLSRLACCTTKLSSRPPEALENAMHLMDASTGKAKLLRASRQNMAMVRHFVYSARK